MAVITDAAQNVAQRFFAKGRFRRLLDMLKPQAMGHIHHSNDQNSAKNHGKGPRASTSKAFVYQLRSSTLLLRAVDRSEVCMRFEEDTVHHASGKC